jgi:hypothetical protein
LEKEEEEMKLLDTDLEDAAPLGLSDYEDGMESDAEANRLEEELLEKIDNTFVHELEVDRNT